MDVLVAVGGATEVLPVSPSFPLTLLRTHPPSLLVYCFFVFAEMGANSTAFEWREAKLFYLRSGVERATLVRSSLILLILFWYRSFTVPCSKMAPFPWLMWGVVFTACVVFSFLSFQSPLPPVKKFDFSRRY